MNGDRAVTRFRVPALDPRGNGKPVLGQADQRVQSGGRAG